MMLASCCLLLGACAGQRTLKVPSADPAPLAIPDGWRYDTLPPIDVRQHPADNYEASILAFEQGRYDDAVFHFYVAELRYRLFLGARPDLPAAFEPARQASLSHVIGMPVRRYLSDKPARRAVIVDAVLRWHDSHDDPDTPKAVYPDVHAQERERLLRERGEATQLAVASR